MLKVRIQCIICYFDEYKSKEEKDMKKIVCLLVVLTSMAFSGCSMNSKTEDTNTSKLVTTQNPLEGIDTSGYSVVKLMEMAESETNRAVSIEYAKRACENQGVEPRVLNVQEISELNKRQDEIDILTKDLSNAGDKASLEKGLELLEEKLNNSVLLFYNDIIMEK